jgi:D-aspartate ligase
MEEALKKVIILTGRELAYQVIRALGREGVRSIVIYGHERDEIAQFSKYVVESYRIPLFFDNTGRLMELLLKKRKEWAGTLIIPTEDYGVRFLSSMKDALSPYYIVPTPPVSTIDTIVNKKSLYSLAAAAGIPVAPVYSPATPEELKALKGKITFPCLLKPGLGHIFNRAFDLKMFEISNFEELTTLYEDLTCNFTRDDFDMMICDIIPGPDAQQMVQYASYIDGSGDLLAAMTTRKIRQDPPKYGQGRVTKSERIDAVYEQSFNLLKVLNYHGFSEIEWKYDPRDGIYKLIEINPRFIFYMGLCVACGVNFPYIQYCDLVRHQKVRIDSFRENVYWIHEYKDVLHTVFNHRLEHISLWGYIRPYLGRKTLAILDMKDPRPFYEQWKQHLINMIRKIRSDMHSGEHGRLSGRR